MKKKINLKPAVMAFAITAIIFLVGGLFGYVIGAEKSRILLGEMSQVKNDLQNLQLELFYIEVMGENSSCSIMEAETEHIDKQLSQLGLRLKSLEDAKEFSDEFFALKNEYMFLQIRSWLFYRKFSKKCDVDSVDVVYFFSSKHCVGCAGQAAVLNPLNEKLGHKLLVFSLDVEWDQPIMQAIKKDFNITSVPALVINGEKHGFTNREKFLDLICPLYKEKPDVC